MSYDFDVLYLGSGHGTFNGAIPLAMAGKKIGVIEKGLIGGTCPNRGCNAKISLDMPALTKHNAERLQGSGLKGIPEIDWTANVKHKDEVIKPLPDSIGELMKSVGIELIHGDGELTDNHTISVDGHDYTAEKIVIATGAHYHQLDIPGKEYLHDGTDFLDLKEQPENMVVIGSGYIAMEFANIAAAAGTKVTVLMHHDVALAKFYQPFVKKIIAAMKKQGVEFITDVETKSVKKADDSLLLNTNKGDFKSDWILNATGRPANVAGIGLDNVGINYDRNGIKVNDHLQTNVDNIYASGDVIDKKVGKLTPTAEFESEYLTALLSGQTDQAIDYPAIPSAVFTLPRIAQVGVTVDEAEQNPDEFTIKDIDLATDWFRAIRNENEGAGKVIYNKKGIVVGAVEVSDQAENVITNILPAIVYKLTPEQRHHMVTLFPTIGSESWTKL